MKKFSEKNTQKKTLVFEHYNLMDPMEFGISVH